MSQEQLQGLRRGIRVLNLLAENGGRLSFNVIQQLCDQLPAPTLSRLLKVLIDEELVQKSRHGQYEIGKAARDFAAKLQPELPGDRVQAIVEALSRRFGHSAAYFELSGTGLTLLAKHDHQDSFRYIDRYAYSPDLQKHAFGKVILANVPTEERNRLVAACLPAKAIPRELFDQQITQIQGDGLYVGADGCIASLFRIVAPVRRVGTAPGAIGITTFNMNLDSDNLEVLCQAVTAAAVQAERIFTDLRG